MSKMSEIISCPNEPTIQCCGLYTSMLFHPFWPTLQQKIHHIKWAAEQQKPDASLMEKTSGKWERISIITTLFPEPLRILNELSWVADCEGNEPEGQSSKQSVCDKHV